MLNPQSSRSCQCSVHCHLSPALYILARGRKCEDEKMSWTIIEEVNIQNQGGWKFVLPGWLTYLSIRLCHSPLPISKPELNGVAVQQMQVLEVTGGYLWIVLWTFLWPIQLVNVGFGFLGRVDRFLVSLMFVANQVALTYRSGCQVWFQHR